MISYFFAAKTEIILKNNKQMENSSIVTLNKTIEKKSTKLDKKLLTHSSTRHNYTHSFY
ncbi:hypothetical protein CCP2SC5_330007 [Azospirillaceae bacterium]